MLSESLEKFKRLTKRPERFLQAQHDVTDEIKDLLKTVYDFTKKQEGSENNLNTLPTLVIKDFDDEQIWQELELQNSAKYTKFILDVPRLLASKDKLNLQIASEGSDIEDYDNDDLIGTETGHQENVDLEIDTEEDDSQENKINKKNAKEKRNAQPSIVDDKFFKLSQLEEFLEKEDRKENQKHKSKQYDDSNESEGSVNLFDDIPSDENEMGESRAHYEEFFDVPEDEEEHISRRQKRSNSEMNEDENDEELNDEFDDHDDGGIVDDDDKLAETPGGKNEKQVRFDLSPASSTDSDSEDSIEDERKEKKNDDAKHPKSSFEIRQERLQKRIKALEEKALAEKSWQMKGEVSSTTRPQNSLLEEVLEYDLASRPAPVMTEQTTLKLEDVIRQRVKDKSWDDVERKVKPTVAPDEYKKKLVMDHEKSKFSLAEIYEQEYLKQKEAQDNDEKPEEEPKEHRTIRAMTSSLFAKLDALTNFHYTPKPVIPEVKIVSNLPAITIEEVAPVAVNDATLLAPEEVKAKQKGDLVGKEERTKTDRKRERRKKKQLQRIKQREKEKREKIVEKLNPGLGNKYSKEKALKTLEKLSGDKNVHHLQDEGKDKGVRSSTAFFTRLQDEVVEQIKGKSKESKKKENEKFSAKRMKL